MSVSKYIPKDLLPRYEEALDNQQLLSMRSNIALLDVRIGTILESFGEARPDSFWLDCQKTWTRFMGAVRAGDANDQAECVRRLGETIAKGASYAEMWGDLLGAMEQQRKLADTEQRRLIAMNQMLTVQEAMLLMVRLVTVVKEAIIANADPVTAEKVGDAVTIEYQKLITDQSDPYEPLGMPAEKYRAGKALRKQRRESY